MPEQIVKISTPQMLDGQADASGKAVCKGEVLYKSEWIAVDTLVTFLLDGADNKYGQGVILESRENYNIEQQKKESVQPQIKEE